MIDDPSGPDIHTQRVLAVPNADWRSDFDYRYVSTATEFLQSELTIPALWGGKEQPVWARGEPFLIFGDPGSGKSTLAQRLCLSLLDRTIEVLLGLPVADVESILYLAADRPEQVKRSLARMEAPDSIRDRLLIHRGPAPIDIGHSGDPERFVEWVTRTGVDLLVVDSLKDAALDLSKDETGNRVSRALQILVREGVDVLILNHPRKSQGAKARKILRLDDSYGSAWVAAASGSVMALEGLQRDKTLRLRHLKSPAEPIGPWDLGINLHDGSLFRRYSPELLALVREAGIDGVTVGELVRMQGASDDDTSAMTQRTRRSLKRLAEEGFVNCVQGGKDEQKRQVADRWVAPKPRPAVAIPDGTTDDQPGDRG